MAIEKVPMTKEGAKCLQDELKHLKSVERPGVIQAISEARAHGDLSENAEYHAARERQGFIEGRIKYLESTLSHAEIIDVAKLSGTKVKFGATVALFEEGSNQEITYQIVGLDEADIKKGLISISSPLARSLLTKDVGDVAEVNSPGGNRSYEILKVEFK